MSQEQDSQPSPRQIELEKLRRRSRAELEAKGVVFEADPGDQTGWLTAYKHRGLLEVITNYLLGAVTLDEEKQAVLYRVTLVFLQRRGCLTPAWRRLVESHLQVPTLDDSVIADYEAHLDSPVDWTPEMFNSPPTVSQRAADDSAAFAAWLRTVGEMKHWLEHRCCYRIEQADEDVLKVFADLILARDEEVSGDRREQAQEALVMSSDPHNRAWSELINNFFPA